MRMGIIGLPQAGKTTIFNALTRGSEPTGVGVGRMEVHTAVVDVPDDRLEGLEAMFHPKKKIYAKVTYADITGLGGASEKGEITGQLLNQLSQMDGFIHVVRAFNNPEVAHVHQRVDPQGDVMLMDDELMLNDQIKVEHRLEKLADEHRKGVGRDKGVVEREIALFEKLGETLNNGQPLRDLDLTKEDDAVLSGFGFLSRKPMLVLVNLGEGQQQPPVRFDHQRTAVVSIQGKLEMDISQLPEADAAMFMAEYGLSLIHI